MRRAIRCLRRNGVHRLWMWIALIVLGGALSFSQAMPANQFAEQPDWWRRAVIYEIYPRSFGDSNNDGTGDLKGITEHLDYLQQLGVDAIWIAPCFPSPQVDFGYDVSDYEAIDPRYGTLSDLDTLIAEAKKRGIKVLLDFVMNHSSDQHRWFRESRKSKSNPYRDYYIWRDGKNDGPPNGWTSIWAGSAWQRDDATGQWYYHAFDPHQPDLNWRNPAVEKEMFDVARFWFERGVYGFRLDAVDNLFEDPQLRDNPAPVGKSTEVERMFNANLPEVHTELQKLRKVADEFPGRVLIGETWTDTPQELAAYYGPHHDELQLPMYFNFTTVDQLSAPAFRAKIAAIESNAVQGWPAFVLSNHDIRRWVDRYGDGKHNDAIAKLMAAMLLTLRGTAILYYGEELGMTTHDPERLEDVQDVIGKNGWPQEKGRDGERTPMQWNSTVNAGFNAGTKTWLAVNPNYKTVNVETESADPHALLNWYRALIALRREKPALYDGDYKALNVEDEDCLVYVRQAGDQKILVALNMSGQEQTIRLDTKETTSSRVLLSSRETRARTMQQITLEPFGVMVAELK